MYGAADGLGCHRRADGEELVESAVYDYGEDMGYDADRDDALAVFAGEDGASLGVGGLRREGGGRDVRFVDDHGHVQAVVLLGRRDEGWRVESFMACSPG